MQPLKKIYYNKSGDCDDLKITGMTDMASGYHSITNNVFGTENISQNNAQGLFFVMSYCS